MAKKKIVEKYDDEHATLVTWVNEADDATIDSRQLAEKCRDYYDGKQWTPAEVSKLKAQKQAATVINRIKPKVDGLLGMERTQRTTAKAFPRTPKHESDATAATEAIRFVLQDNFFEQVRSSTAEFLWIEGTGGYDVTVKPVGEDFKITIASIPWDRIIYDPHCRTKHITEKTARYAGQVKWMDYDEAVSQYPQAKDVIEAMQDGSDTYDDKPRWMDNTRRRCKIVEMYYWWGKELRYALFTRGGFVESPRPSPFKNEEGEQEWCYEFASSFVTREGDRYGSVAQYLDVQDEINKRRSKALHLMSVRQVAYQKGAVEDPNVLRKELAKPDGAVELTMPLKDSFDVLKTGDMAAAQFNLLTEAKSEIDAVGYNAAVAGKDQNAISGVALRQRQMSGQTELAPLFDVLKHLDHRVYRKVWNRIKQYWTGEKWIRVTDDEQNLKWVGLNQRVQTPEGMMTQNNLAELDVDIVIDDAPDAITTQIEDFQVLGEMVKSGFPIPPEAVVMMSPLSHKDQVLKMMKEQPQIPPQVQEQMKKMQEETQKLAQENQQLKADQQTEFAKLQVERAKAEEQLKLEREKAAAELQLEREKAAAEIELEKAKFGIQADLEAAKIQADAQNQQQKIESDFTLQRQKAANDLSVQKQKVKGDMAVKSLELGQPINLDMEKDEREEAERQQKMQEEAAFKEETRNGTSQIVAALQKLIELQVETLAAIRAPKTVALSDVRRVNGQITGATVQQQLLN